MEFNSQSLQDKFILSLLSEKRHGFFLDIGSRHPSTLNTSYILEKNYNWHGLSVNNDIYSDLLYTTMRSSPHIMQDPTTVDYAGLFRQYSFPPQMDYLQINLDVQSGTALKTLERISSLFSTYTFSIVIFKHDIYTGNHYNTRNRSRQIFQRNGYILLFGDVRHGGNQYEDWYVHPHHVNMTRVDSIKTSESLEYTELSERLDRIYTFTSM
jgi:hypothetical protein